MNDNYTVQQSEMIQQIKKKLEIGQAQSTFVEMQTDYDNDIQICLTSSFCAPEYRPTDHQQNYQTLRKDRA